MTVRDLIRLSMLDIGVLAEGEVPNASQLEDAFTKLNSLLDTWSNQKLFIYSMAQEIFQFVGGQQVYQMGPGAPDFNTTRPVYLEGAAVRISYGNPEQIDIPLQILNIDEWMSISIKNTPSVWPTRVYMDNSFPNANLYFWPIPQESVNVYLVSWKPLTAFSNANSDSALPPGYAEALEYALAVRLCPMYGKTASPEIIALERNATGKLKVSLSKMYIMRADEGVLPVDRVFNYLTGY